MTDTLFDASPLAADEQVTVDEAMAQGYLWASGQRLAVLLAFKERCARAGRLAVTVRTGSRVGTVEVDGKTRWRGPLAGLQEAVQDFTRGSRSDATGGDGLRYPLEREMAK